MPKLAVKAVLFDFDGTLAVTMEDNFKAWQAAMSDYGLKIKPEDYYPLEGASVYEVAKKIFSQYGVKSSNPEEAVRKKELHYLENHRFRFYPGVEALIEALRSKHVPLALVTAGLRSRLDHSVPRGFLEKFDAVVTGDEAREGKPSPEPFLLAAEKLKVRPEDCVVVENAPLGIQSAKKAGMYCIALCTTLQNGHLKEADEIVSSFEDLKNCEGLKGLLG